MSKIISLIFAAVILVAVGVVQAQDLGSNIMRRVNAIIVELDKAEDALNRDRPAAFQGYIGFTAYYGFYAGFFGCLVELYGAVQVAVVGNRQAVHVHFFGPVDQLGYAAHGIQEAVLGMDMQVGKFHGLIITTVGVLDKAHFRAPEQAFQQ